MRNPERNVRVGAEAVAQLDRALPVRANRAKVVKTDKVRWTGVRRRAGGARSGRDDQPDRRRLLGRLPRRRPRLRRGGGPRRPQRAEGRSPAQGQAISGPAPGQPAAQALDRRAGISRGE
jgi:hypothetical protein